MVFGCLRGSYKEDRDPLFARSHMKKTRNYSKNQERFHLNIRKKFFVKDNHLQKQPP